MTQWIRRNTRALLIVLLMTDLIGITVTRPAWQDNIGFRKPKITVPYRHSAVIGGVRWQLTPTTLPNEQELRKYSYGSRALEELPPNSRLATYLWQRTKDGKPAGVPAGYDACEPIAVSGNRQWSKRTVSLALDYWAKHVGYTTLCLPKYTGPLIYAVIVPKDVHLTSIDVSFLPSAWSDKTKLSKNSDLLVVRFDVD
jgi:hypothetical protein